MPPRGGKPALHYGAWFRRRKDRRAEKPGGVKERKLRAGALRYEKTAT